MCDNCQGSFSFHSWHCPIHACCRSTIITFADPWDAENNVALWAHEVKHAEQFRAWGVYEFARAYVQDHTTVEAEAYAIGASFKALYGGG